MVPFKLASLLLTLVNIDAKHTSIRGSNRLAKANTDADTLNKEDVEFWTRMLQVGSLPSSDLPTGKPTGRPTSRPTPNPSRRPTPNPVTPAPTFVELTYNPTITPSEVSTPVPSPAPSAEPITPMPSPAPSEVTPEPSPEPSPEPITPVPSPEPTLIIVDTFPPTPPPVPITPQPSPEPSPEPITPVPSPEPTLIIIDTFPPTPPPVPITPQPSPEPTIATPAPTFPCNLTPEERASQLRQLYSAFSENDLFDDPFTPQAQALDWITNLDTLQVCPDDNSCQPLQRYILATFYFATNGGGWDQCNAPGDFNDAESIREANNNCNRIVTPFAVPNQRVGDESTDAWLTPSNECEWGGVACWGADTPNLNQCIDQLDFENDGIAGTLVNELGALDTLRFFILEQGGITGSIPTTFGLLERLLILDLDFNSVEGQIPNEIYGLSSLQQLDLNDNLISGTISPLIGDLNLLTFFQIDHNLITGTIPTEMGELDNLRIAFLSDTLLTGTMPDEVCANRNTTTPPGNLGVLTADCAGNPPELECTCCSSCASDINMD